MDELDVKLKTLYLYLGQLEFHLNEAKKTVRDMERDKDAVIREIRALETMTKPTTPPQGSE